MFFLAQRDVLRYIPECAVSVFISNNNYLIGIRARLQDTKTLMNERIRFGILKTGTAITPMSNLNAIK